MKDSFKAVMLVLFVITAELFAGCETETEPEVKTYHTAGGVTLETVNSQIPELTIVQQNGTFTATEGFISYLWKIDGELAKSGSDNTYTPDTESLSAGYHNILLFVTDSEGAFNSVTAVVTVNK